MNDEVDVMQYYDLVWSTAWKMRSNLCGVLELGDLVSAAFLEIVKLSERFDTNGPPFIRLAYPRIRGAMLDMLRNEIRVDPRLGNKTWDLTQNSNSTEDRILAKIDAHTYLEKASRFNATDADILRYFYIEGMEAKEIAPIVGMAVSTVWVHLHRIKRQLRGQRRAA